MTEDKKKFYENEGYLIFNIDDNNLIDQVNKDIENILKNEKSLKKNTKIYSYNNSPRIVESYKKSENCKNLAKHDSVVKMIEFLYDKKPLAFFNINLSLSSSVVGVINLIKSKGIKVGVAVNPSTEIEKLYDYKNKILQ